MTEDTITTILAVIVFAVIALFLIAVGGGSLWDRHSRRKISKRIDHKHARAKDNANQAIGRTAKTSGIDGA